VASALCDVLIGATLDDVARISAGAVAKLAGLDTPSTATRMVHFAKSAALSPFLGRAAYAGTGIVCVCFGISGDEIRNVIRTQCCRSVEDVKRHLPASQGCGTCRPEIQALLDAE
jgi:NAD(P)H-nitrite reductase large subunit